MARLIPLLLAVPMLAGCGRVWLPESAEKRVGEMMAKEMIARMPLVENSPWAAFVQDAGKKLSSASERPNYDYRFRIVSSPEINAFALPDGEIFITDSLLKLAGRDWEAVASVLGHEVGHVARRHTAENIQSQLGFEAGLLVLFGVNDSLARGVATLASKLIELGYGRDMEMEADLCGVRYLARLGYPPETGLKFLKVMAAQERGRKTSTIERYLQNHPPTEERLRYAKAYADSIVSASLPPQ